jgi:hypothetical protein
MSLTAFAQDTIPINPIKNRKMKTCLIVGLKPTVIEDAKNHVTAKNVVFYTATNLQEVKDIFSQHHIDIVAMGAGLDLKDRLNIVQYIFENSNSTSVHMKDKDSGPTGMLPFVNQILNGLMDKE